MTDPLRDALERRDAAVALCPYMKACAPSSNEACTVCGADSSEPCRKRIIADADFVADTRQALASSEGQVTVPAGMVKALRWISEHCPATCDMTLAHEMAAVADEALAALASTPKLHSVVEQDKDDA